MIKEFYCETFTRIIIHHVTHYFHNTRGSETLLACNASNGIVRVYANRIHLNLTHAEV